MVDIPQEAQFKILLCQGRTYLFKAEEHRGNNKHFHVILNIEPHNDGHIVMVVATTISVSHMTSLWEKLQKQGILVQAVVGDAEFVKHPTLFRCDEPIVRKREEIISKLGDGLLLQKGIVTNPLLNKLRQGLLNSKTVDEWIKALVR